MLTIEVLGNWGPVDEVGSEALEANIVNLAERLKSGL
jgi:hypothetical protein